MGPEKWRRWHLLPEALQICTIRLRLQRPRSASCAGVGVQPGVCGRAGTPGTEAPSRLLVCSPGPGGRVTGFLPSRVVDTLGSGGGESGVTSLGPSV